MILTKENTNIVMGYTSRYIRGYSHEISRKDYENLKQIFNNLHIEHTMYYENDKHRSNGVHVHGTMSIPKKVFRSLMIRQIKDEGYYFHLQYLTDLTGWHKYCIKEQKMGSKRNI